MPLFKRRFAPEDASQAGRENSSNQPLQTTSIDGRRYYVDQQVPYALPKDMADVNRLDFQHYLYRLTMQSNYIAPLETSAVQNILDVGCGTGRWGLEMAHDFPASQITGLDLEDLHQPEAVYPPNYHFISGNILHGLPFADHTFDFVHQRLLVMGIPQSRWTTLIQELIRVTKPGGYIELVEGGATLSNTGPLTELWLQWIQDASRERGIDPARMDCMGHYAKEAGMRNCTTRTFDIPVGAWGKRAGKMQEANFIALFYSLRPHYPADYRDEQTLLHLVDEWNRLHTVFHFYVVTGQP